MKYAKKIFMASLFATLVGVPAANANIVSEAFLKPKLDAKQNKLSVTDTGSGAIISAIAVDGGTLTVTKSNVTIPNGGINAEDQVAIWVQ